MDSPAKFLSDQPYGRQPIICNGARLGRTTAGTPYVGSFCGVGGFGLHCATPQMQLTGIEIAPEAIACAKQSAAELGLTRLHFQALDSTQFATAQGETPDLVLVNPPRRGIGKPLCDYLAQMARVLSFIQAVTRRRWRRIFVICRTTVFNVFSFSICSRIPRIMRF